MKKAKPKKLVYPWAWTGGKLSTLNPIEFQDLAAKVMARAATVGKLKKQKKE